MGQNYNEKFFVLAKYGIHLVIITGIPLGVSLYVLHAEQIISTWTAILVVRYTFVTYFLLGLIQTLFMFIHPEVAVEKDVEPPVNRKQKAVGMDKILHPETPEQSKRVGLALSLLNAVFVILSLTVNVA